jgi:hypothetical protein
LDHRVVWAVSSRKEVCVSELEGIEESALAWRGLKAIAIPLSVVVLGKENSFVPFESGPRLERIEEFALSESGARSIVIALMIVVLGSMGFFRCKSLASVTLENDSRLHRIEESAFSGSRFKPRFVPWISVVRHLCFAS